MAEKVAHILATGANVVVNRQLIYNYPESLLAAAGVLEGRRATSHWMVVPMLRAFGATPANDERIVQEGRIVTAAGVSAGIDLGLWLAGQLGGEAQAKAIQLAIEYDPQPPFTESRDDSGVGPVDHHVLRWF